MCGLYLERVSELEAYLFRLPVLKNKSGTYWFNVEYNIWERMNYIRDFDEKFELVKSGEFDLPYITLCSWLKQVKG